jgi:hypothetical protein
VLVLRVHLKYQYTRYCSPNELYHMHARRLSKLSRKHAQVGGNGYQQGVDLFALFSKNR